MKRLTYGVGVSTLALGSILVVPSAMAEEAATTESAVSTENCKISTAADLAQLAELVNGGTTFAGVTCTLENDLDLSGVNYTPVGIGYFKTTSEYTNKPFQGSFDGQNHTISGLTITLSDSESSHLSTDKNGESSEKTAGNNYTYNENGVYYAAGLFGLVQGGTISNLTITGANVAGVNAEAAVVGNLVGGTVENVTVKNSTVKGVYENAGALIGMSSGNITVKNNTADNNQISVSQDLSGTATTKNENGAGGLMGRTQGGSSVAISGNVVTNSTISAYRKAAGLVGYVLQPGNTVLSNNKVEDTKITINDAAKNNNNDPYMGVFTAEVQGNPNTNRAYETYAEDGTISMKGEFGSSKYDQSEGNTYARINYAESVEVAPTTTETATISADGNESALKEALASKTENGESTANVNASVEIVAEEASTDSFAAGEAEKTEALIAEKSATKLGAYDITINYLENGEVKGQIEETASPIALEIQLNDETVSNLPAVADGYTRNWYVIRAHDGEAEFIPASYDESTHTLRFTSDKFSVFTVAYADIENTNTETTTTTDTTENPDTYDPIMTIIALTLVSAMVAASSVVFLKR